MTDDQSHTAQEAADRVVEFAEELEASADASLGGSSLAAARAALHQWIDEMTGVVVAPALGRVTIIHPNGRQSTIASPDLPFTMSVPLDKG